MRVASRLVFVLTLLAAAALPLSAQTLVGTTREANDSTPIRGVAVLLLDVGGTQRASAISDQAGRFRLQVPGPGAYTLRAVHIAFDTVASAIFEVEIDHAVEVEVRMGERALVLDPITVSVQADPRRRVLREFYDRAQRNRIMGVGRVLLREDVERSAAMNVDALLRLQPALQEQRVAGGGRAIVFRRGGTICTPDLYVNGLPTTNEELNIPLTDIEGVEVYRGATEVPPEYSYGSACGVILVWTRIGEDSSRPFSWKRMFVGGGILLGIVILGLSIPGL